MSTSDNSDKPLHQEGFKPPCHDCVEAIGGPNMKPAMCGRVARIALAVLSTELSLDTSSGPRPEGVIATQYIGANSLADAAIQTACRPLTKPRPEMSILEKINY